MEPLWDYLDRHVAALTPSGPAEGERSASSGPYDNPVSPCSLGPRIIDTAGNYAHDEDILVALDSNLRQFQKKLPCQDLLGRIPQRCAFPSPRQLFGQYLDTPASESIRT
ncbi:hypothetical protein TNCV_2126491 [Trichonephila clavipes]|nr:hypothetical protein TNCV_2126491 [Trichonephila clavipes]